MVSLKQAETIESALPEGFQERVKERGIVHGVWVPQQLILRHPSVGCFMIHFGSGSLSEAMVNDCQLVLLPQVGDPIINARLMAGDLKVGLEVEKGEEDGLFTNEDVSKAVKAVMDDDKELFFLENDICHQPTIASGILLIATSTLRHFSFTRLHKGGKCSGGSRSPASSIIESTTIQSVDTEKVGMHWLVRSTFICVFIVLSPLS
ncbi:hypothetical protein DITRI_Ditri19aG0043300 [Diplodiscus trichospermus]